MEKAEYLELLTTLHAKLKDEHNSRVEKTSTQSVQLESAIITSSVNAKTEEAFLLRYGSLIKEIREEADKNTAAALTVQEDRLRNHYVGIIEHLENELRMALAVRETADAVWLDDQSKRDKSQAYLLHYIEEKCRDAYIVSQSEYDKRANELCSRYDRLLEEAELERIKQKQKYDVKYGGLIRAVKNWKVDHQHTLHNRYSQLQHGFERSYNRKLEALQKEVNKVSSEKFAISQTHLASPIAGLSAGQIQILRYQFDLLKLDPAEQNKILFDILGNIYSVTTHIDLLSANIKKMAEVHHHNEVSSSIATLSSNSPQPDSSEEFDKITAMTENGLNSLQKELDAENALFEKSLGQFLKLELQNLSKKLIEIDNLTSPPTPNKGGETGILNENDLDNAALGNESAEKNTTINGSTGTGVHETAPPSPPPRNANTNTYTNAGSNSGYNAGNKPISSSNNVSPNQNNSRGLKSNSYINTGAIQRKKGP